MASSHHPQLSLRPSVVVGAIVVTVAVSGYFMGLLQTNSAINRTNPIGNVQFEGRVDLTGIEEDAPSAVRYIDQDWSANGPNGAWHTELTTLNADAQPVENPEMPISPYERAKLIEKRSGRRAFDGAPPTVPHAIVHDSAASCLVCHENGLQVRGTFASQISHAKMGSCTQCHVSDISPLKLDSDPLSQPLAMNDFDGVTSSGKGERAALEGTPPTIPPRHHAARQLHELPRHQSPQRPAHAAPASTSVRAVSRPQRRKRAAGVCSIPSHRSTQDRGQGMSAGFSRRDFFSQFMRPLQSKGTREAEALAVIEKEQVAVIQGRFCLAYTSICSVCSERCPEPGAIKVERGIPMVDAALCTGCGICHEVCPAPRNAILLLERKPTP